MYMVRPTCSENNFGRILLELVESGVVLGGKECRIR